MTIYATARPGPSYAKNRHVCWRCGIEHGGRQEMCRDCDDVENPKPCSRGHERTEDNVYLPASGKPQCGACKRMHRTLESGWQWACQLCGRRADQGEDLCRACGQSHITEGVN